jgi:hypothetical protein
MSTKYKIYILIAITLVINASVFFYAWNQGQETAETACNASALVSANVADIHRRNMAITYPELYRNDQITIEGLTTLTNNSVSAILKLKEAERTCVRAVD